MIDDVEVRPVRVSLWSNICAYRPSNRGDNSYSVNDGGSSTIIGKTFAVLPHRSRPRSLPPATKVRYGDAINAVACQIILGRRDKSQKQGHPDKITDDAVSVHTFPRFHSLTWPLTSKESTMSVLQSVRS